VVLVWTTHLGVLTEGKMGTVNRQRLGVQGIGAGRERRVVFRPQVDFLSVLSDVGEGVATYHGRVVSLAGMRREGGLKVVGSPGNISPGGILATILMMVKVRHVWTDGVGVVELLHEGTSRVGKGNLVGLLPGMVDN
jgi:hypothetical protein